MDITLLDDMQKHNNNDFPNWVKIQQLMPNSFSNTDLLDYDQSHTSTRSKVTFADYHYHILEQLYQPHVTEREKNTVGWVRAEFHSIVMNLYSALDSLAYEINLAYNFGLRINQIYIHHNHSTFVSDCFRCNLNNENDSLTSLLNNELNKSWFQTFNKLRNQIIHKNLPVIQIILATNTTTTKIKIPDDPSNTSPQINDYSQDLEINCYCKDLRNNVVKIIEQVYPLIEPKIKSKYCL
ncbi:MAG: hypothetical protein FJ356_02685 [Thaumarchaeota archaeon]|nr:hypothetical protein [Nitrososphaerota archaeon]